MSPLGNPGAPTAEGVSEVQILLNKTLQYQRSSLLQRLAECPPEFSALLDLAAEARVIVEQEKNLRTIISEAIKSADKTNYFKSRM